MNIDSSFEHLQLLSHPFYQAWMKGELSKETLRDYAAQYFTHVDAFPRYLGAIHSHCADSKLRRQILENLNDEEGVGYPASHPDLWVQFAEGMGCTRGDVLGTKPRQAITRVKNTFMAYARSSFAEGLGALYAYESQVPEVANSKIEGLIRMYGITDEKTLQFFKVHATADIEHRDVIRNMIESLSASDQEKAHKAAREAAESLWDFLSEVYDRRAA